MGFLIAKSDQVPADYEITGSDIKFRTFKIKNRSVDMSIQTYRFKEKGFFDFDFDYIPEATWRNLIYLFQNRNSLRPGYYMTPIPYSHSQADSILSISAANANKAYDGQFAFKPWEQTLDNSVSPIKLGTTAMSEFSGANYNDIDNYDANDTFLSAVASKYSVYVFEFDISGFLSTYSFQELRRLTLQFNGMRSSPIRFYIYDFTNAGWYLMREVFYYVDSGDMSFSDPAFYLYQTLTSALAVPWGNNTIFDDFVDSSKVYFMVVNPTVQQLLNIQFIRLFINGYHVITNDPEDIENFANAFTEAGRAGSIMFEEA